MTSRPKCLSKTDVNKQIYNALINSGLKPNQYTFSNGKGNAQPSINLNNISQYNSCGFKCQAEKKKNQGLYTKYIDAGANLRNAPNNLSSAEKNYYINVLGQSRYNDLLMEKYKSEIKKIVFDEKNLFSIKKKNIVMLLDYYKKNILLNEKLDELIENTIKENKSIIDTTNKIVTTKNTNERIVYYDNKQIEYIKNMKKINVYLLLILYILFISGILIFRKDLLNKKLILFFSILLIIPLFFIPVITRFLLTIYNWITNNSNNDNNVSVKLLFDIYNEFKLFLGFFYSPIDFLL
jgi:hypothetical protein